MYEADRVTDGFELIGNLFGPAPNPVPYELTPGVAFKKGDMVVKINGKVAKAAANYSNILGVMAENIAAADNPAAKTTYGAVYDNPFNIYRCTFADHRDAAATGGAADGTTLVDTALATGTDDVWNGALLYIYEGPGIGSIRTVKDYAGTGDVITVEEPFPAQITTSSKYILLGAAAAVGDVINIGSVGVDLKDENTIDANATIVNEAGPLAVLRISPKDLMMDVLIRKHVFNSV